MDDEWKAVPKVLHIIVWGGCVVPSALRSFRSLYRVSDGQFAATIRRLHYRYDPEVTAGEFDEDRRAEQWITDDNALTKNGTKLARISGKFRTHTIDRVHEIFHEAAKATGAIVRKMQWVEE